ncbi:hypothetical protein [Sandarakinorhabdus sp. DWP1-3-1]|uniref:hypothetical protein n=1 Tax=Sandarakinorhabdus sp. DWP1-3-1 TaxID=2804627 RepID=UPI003CEF48B8
MRPTLPAAALALSAAPAAACNICHSPTALGVRHLLFDHDFLANAAAVAAPVPVLLAIVFAVARG